MPYGPKQTATTDVPWDGVWWWARPDRMLQLVPSSRFIKQPELIAPYQVTTPLWAAHTIVLDPKKPRTEEANGTEDAHRFVSVVGAAWLLMGQPAVTETRAIADTTSPPRPAGDAGPALDIAPTPRVTIVELRRPVRLPNDKTEGTSDRQFTRRWWVGGHWRQQACGSNHSESGRNGLPRISKGRKTSR